MISNSIIKKVLATTGAISIILFILSIVFYKKEISIKKGAKAFWGTLIKESEKYASKNKAVIKAEELGVKLTPSNYVAILSISILAGIIMAIAFKSIFMVIIGLLIGYMLPENIIEVSKINKQKSFLLTAIPGVEFIAINNMHTSNMIKSITQAIPNMQSPFKEEMEQVVTEVNSGKHTLEQSLDRMVIRTKSKYLKKVANSIKFADTIGGSGYKMLQRDANLLHKDKTIYEKAERRLKKTKLNSYISSLLQLLPFIMVKISLPETYDYVMGSIVGQLLLFAVMIKIIIDFYVTGKKTRSIML